MNKIFKYKIIKGLVLLIMLGAMPWSVSGQDGTGSDTEADEQMKGVIEAFLDWAAISFATYTGQHEAEMGSIFAKAKDGLEKYPELQELINDNTNGQGGMLAEGVNALTTKTGVKVYFLPQMANPDNKFYINSFNGFLAEGSANLIPPYILVKMDISGNNKAGYTVSCTVEASDDVKSNKYNLKSMDADNPFFGLNMTAPLRKNMASQMKLSLYNGVGALHDEMDGSLREDLSILHAGTLYRTGEELEVAYDEDKPTVLQVEDKDGQAPSKSVTWTLDPSDAEFETSGHQLTLAPQAGQWKVTATAGNKSTHVFLKSVDFNLDWKDIVKTLLYEALQTKLDQTKAKIDSLEAASPGFDSELQNQLQKIEAANYPLETNSNPLFSAYQEPQVLTGQDTVKFYSNATRAEGFKKLRKFKGHLVNVLQQVNMAAVIDILVEDPKRFETLLNNMGDNISSLVLELIASGLNRTERDQKIKDIIFNYLNAHLVELADAEFASKHESYQVSTEAIPEPSSQVPTLENENYYISPLVYFPGIEEFKTELSTNLAAMDNPPFVVINYSQDLSTEGYLNRAKAGKPKGIGDRPYKVYTLVNIPGSVKMDFVGVSGNTPMVDLLGSQSAMYSPSDKDKVKNILELFRCAYVNKTEALYQLDEYELVTHDISLLDNIEYEFISINTEFNTVDKQFTLDPSLQPEITNTSGKSSMKFTSPDGHYIIIKVNESQKDKFLAYLNPTEAVWSSQIDQFVSSLDGLVSKDLRAAKDAVYMLASCGTEKISLQTKFDFVKLIADEWLVDSDDQKLVLKILSAITTESEANSFLAKLSTNNTGLLSELEDEMTGEQYKQYHNSLARLFFISKGESLVKEIESLSSNTESVEQATLEEWANRKVFFWLNPGFVKRFTQTGGGYLDYSDFDIADNGAISFDIENIALVFSMGKFPVEIQPFDLIRVQLLTSSKDLNGGTGQGHFYLPAINLSLLVNEQSWDEFNQALNSGFIIASFGSGALVQGGRAAMFEAVFTSLNVAALVVDDYRYELTTTEEGRVFLQSWEVFNAALAIWQVAKISVALPKAYRNLKDSYKSFKASNPSKPENFYDKVDDVLKQTEDAFDDISSQRVTRSLDDIVPDGVIPQNSTIDNAFHRWFNKLTLEELDLVLSNRNLNKQLENRIRWPGKEHEWCMVCHVRKFKEWDIPMSEIHRFRTKTAELKWTVPDDVGDISIRGDAGGHGGTGSTTFHNELKKIIEESNDLNNFNSGILQLVDRWQINPDLLPTLIKQK